MPTAIEFRAAALRLRAAADDATLVGDRMWSIGADHGIRGGRLETLVDNAVAANAIGAGTLARQCEGLAELCLQRATVCDDYAMQLVTWQRSVDAWQLRRDAWLDRSDPHRAPRAVGPRPRRPDPPFSWVEVG